MASFQLGVTVRPMFRQVQDQMGKLSSMMQESLTGIRWSRRLRAEPHEFARFDEQNQSWFVLRRAVTRVGQLLARLTLC